MVVGWYSPHHNRHYSSVWIRSAATGSQTLWEAILDYRSGYRKLDVKRAIALKSVYAIRFYELFSGKTEPIIYPVAKLKEMFAIKDKYKQINDFVRKVIEPAKRELDAAAPYSFDFEPVKDGRKIIAFKFTPLHYPQRENEDAEVRDLQRKLSLSLGYPRPPCPRLSKNSIGFTEVEIKNNIEVFRRASELLPDFTLRACSSQGEKQRQEQSQRMDYSRPRG